MIYLKIYEHDLYVISDDYRKGQWLILAGNIQHHRRKESRIPKESPFNHFQAYDDSQIEYMKKWIKDCKDCTVISEKEAFVLML